MATPSQALAPSSETYVGADVIAAKYGVTTRHITGLAVAGDIPAIRVGTLWRFDPVAVHEAFTKPFTKRLPSLS